MQRLAEEINKCGGKTHALAANVTQVKQVKALVDAAVKAYSHIDIIINNTRLMLAYRFNFKSLLNLCNPIRPALFASIVQLVAF